MATWQISSPAYSTSAYAGLQVKYVEVARAGRDLDWAEAVFDRDAGGVART